MPLVTPVVTSTASILVFFWVALPPPPSGDEPTHSRQALTITRPKCLHNPRRRTDAQCPPQAQSDATPETRATRRSTAPAPSPIRCLSRPMQSPSWTSVIYEAKSPTGLRRSSLRRCWGAQCNRLRKPGGGGADEGVSTLLAERSKLPIPMKRRQSGAHRTDVGLAMPYWNKIEGEHLVIGLELVVSTNWHKASDSDQALGRALDTFAPTSCGREALKRLCGMARPEGFEPPTC